MLEGGMMLGHAAMLGYTMSGTEKAYGPVRCYAMSGTEMRMLLPEARGPPDGVQGDVSPLARLPQDR
eukprot:1329437-Rhodomonas_salina.1